jgi:histone H3/H4
MAVEAIGATDTSTTAGRTEFQRFQQKLADDLAAKAAEKVAAKDRVTVERTDTESLRARQMSGATADVGRLGSALDFIV